MLSNKPSLEKPKIKKKRKSLLDYFDFKNNVINKVGLVIFIAFSISTTLTWLFEERFNKEQWKTQPRTRYKMADDIIENKLMIGKTKQDIILLLGHNEMSTQEGSDYLVYRLGKPPSFSKFKEEKLVIIFENDVVVNVIQTNE